jgi:hypothetical protein
MENFENTLTQKPEELEKQEQAPEQVVEQATPEAPEAKAEQMPNKYELTPDDLVEGLEIYTGIPGESNFEGHKIVSVEGDKVTIEKTYKQAYINTSEYGDELTGYYSSGSSTKYETESFKFVATKEQAATILNEQLKTVEEGDEYYDKQVNTFAERIKEDKFETDPNSPNFSTRCKTAELDRMLSYNKYKSERAGSNENIEELATPEKVNEALNEDIDKLMQAFEVAPTDYAPNNEKQKCDFIRDASYLKRTIEELGIELDPEVNTKVEEFLSEENRAKAEQSLRGALKERTEAMVKKFLKRS